MRNLIYCTIYSKKCIVYIAEVKLLAPRTSTCTKHKFYREESVSLFHPSTRSNKNLIAKKDHSRICSTNDRKCNF